MLTALATVLACTLPVGLQDGPADPGQAGRHRTETPPLQARARALAALVSDAPEWPEDLFHPELFQELSPARLRSLFVDLHASSGRVVGIRDIDEPGDESGGESGSLEGRFRLELERAREARLNLRLEPAPPYRVTGFFLGTPIPTLADFVALDAELDTLGGVASMLVVELGDADREPLYERHPDARLGVASASKLYVLGALVAAVAAERRAWNDTVVLSARRRSLPAGILQSWPAGSPVTLHTLATLMISRSDNTATDHLVASLGRSRVEAALADMGHGEPARNVPFLTTRELFLLRGSARGAHAERYLALAPAERRAFLDGTLAALSLRDVDPLRLALPEDAGRLEWFASARDLCRAMDWLRRATESAATATARDVLAVSPGLVAADDLAYVGYKGGATGGVLNHTWLARTRDGRWLAVAATWNDPQSTLQPERFAGLAARAVELAARPARDG